ncbi:MAG: substrate-binding domain-containing protein [Muribaculaceae bacterium]|nr:substrate-binding domain-containing protein [Muribaculaceae bacterium]
MNKVSQLILGAAAVALGLGAVSCIEPQKKGNSSTSGTATFVCDNTFENIFEQEVDVFEYQYPDAHLLVRYATQTEAFDSLFTMNTRTIVAARDITPEERRALTAKYRNERNANVNVRSARIAVDAIAFIVNPENTCEKLTVSEIADIISGRTTQWNDLEPSDLGAIRVIVDQTGSSLGTYLRDSVLHGGNLGENVYSAGSIPEVFNIVERNKNAIGVLGVSWISSDMDSADISREELAQSVLAEGPVMGTTLTQRVKVLKINRDNEVRAYKPYQQYIYDGSYPFFRSIYMITAASTSNVAGGFYSFVTGPIGQKIIIKTGIMPAHVSIQRVELPE